MFLVGDVNTKDFELSSINKSLNLLCCHFLEECNRDFIIFKNIYTLLYEHIVFLLTGRHSLVGHSCFSRNKSLQLMCSIQFQSL